VHLQALQNIKAQLAAYVEVVDAAFTKSGVSERTQIWLQVGRHASGRTRIWLQEETHTRACPGLV